MLGLFLVLPQQSSCNPFLAIDNKIPSAICVHGTTSFRILGSFVVWTHRRASVGWLWRGCLVGSQWGAGKAISHCSLSPAVNEAHNAFTCASKQKLLLGDCAVALMLGDCTEGQQVGSISAGHWLPRQSWLRRQSCHKYLQLSGPSVLKNLSQNFLGPDSKWGRWGVVDGSFWNWWLTFVVWLVACFLLFFF